MKINRHKSPIKKLLIDDWYFLDNKKNWRKATVPGCIHTDLLEHQIIGDPFYGENEASIQWIHEQNWNYRLIFTIEKEICIKDNIILCFEGIDTFADVFLNDEKIIAANNMFHPWKASIKNQIKSGTNEIMVKFRSPTKEVEGSAGLLEYKLPADNDRAGKTSPFVRKAPYHYGWDWGPCLITAGIWKNVYILAYNFWHVENLSMTTIYCNEDRAKLNLELLIISKIRGEVTINISEVMSKTNITLTKNIQSGENKLIKKVEICKPKLWWPRGHGEQNLYKFIVLVKSEKCMQTISREIGIRHVVIDRPIDARGQGFEIHVNGYPIYSKGANWIPADSFTTRIKSTKYQKLIDDACNANMNTLRVWGGGIYEPDIFYELCDKKGIMVWQDFMFACSMYPSHSQFLHSIKKEVSYQINRLKSYACIILWCGNNEVASGWLKWGWREILPQSVWDDYKKIFHDIIPFICNQYDKSRFYWPSSPGHSLSLPNEDQIYGRGDNHYWGVWHEGKSVEAYSENIGRFMSEYGMQSLPSIVTIDNFVEKKYQTIDSDILKAHQKASLGVENLINYTKQYYRMNNDFRSNIILTQLFQAEAIKFAVEAHRRSMPYCMGTLYWQFNDCWPGISWSSIDYSGFWKAIHYYARNFFRPILLSLYNRKDHIEVHVVNDMHKSLFARLELTSHKFDGNTIFQESLNVKIKPFSSSMIERIKKTTLVGNNDHSKIYIRATISSEDKLLAFNDIFLEKPKFRDIKKPKYGYKLIIDNDRYFLLISAVSFIHQLCLSSGNIKGIFSENYINMIPGQVVQIEFKPDHNIEDLVEPLAFKIDTLYELMY